MTTTIRADGTLLGFGAVAKSLEDKMTVPAGYTASVLIAVGDPIAAGVAAFRNDGTDTGYDRRAGDNHDGMEYFGLSAGGAPDPTGSDRGLLATNHEYINQLFLHANGPTPSPRPASETDIEVDCHGVSVVEIAKSGGRFAYVQNSAFNRRVTAATEIEFAGPARGHRAAGDQVLADRNEDARHGQQLRHRQDALGHRAHRRGELGRLLLPRRRRPGPAHARRRTPRWSATAASPPPPPRRRAATAGRPRAPTTSTRAGTPASPAPPSALPTTTATRSTARATAPRSIRTTRLPLVKKRTALGRMAHESAAFSKPVVGKPLAVYMGDDARNEYIYKFVSTATWVAADATATDRIAVGDKYLDAGKLYVAKFNADGSGEWIELAITTPAIAGYAGYVFADAGDVAIHPRIAGDAVGATKMDRPEWCGVHPTTGEIYFTLTNNSNRRLGAVTGSQLNPDAGQSARLHRHPRRGDGAVGQSATATSSASRRRPASRRRRPSPGTSTCSAPRPARPRGIVNLSGLTADQDFSSPDGLVFTPGTGLCWVQTDDGAYTDVSNCMMLAAVPGTVGDGGALTLDYGASGTVTTRMGAKPTASTLKRFLVGPAGQEITGLCETPDGKWLFVNVQHPGEETAFSSISDPTKYQSHWPGNAGYGAGGASARPRAATVMVAKNDGGRVGT